MSIAPSRNRRSERGARRGPGETPPTRRSLRDARRRRGPAGLRRHLALTAGLLAVPVVAFGLWAVPSSHGAAGPEGDSIQMVADSGVVRWSGYSHALRVTYRAPQDGRVTGVAFRGSAGATRYVASLWDGRARLAVGVTGTVQDGWFEARFPSSPAVRRGRTYTVLYWASPRGSTAATGDGVAVRFTPSRPPGDPTTTPTTATPVPTPTLTPTLTPTRSVTPLPTTPLPTTPSPTTPSPTTTTGPTVTPSPTKTSPTKTSPTKTSPTTPSPTTSSGTGGTRTGCAAQPSTCGYPDASNTGVPAGVTLRKVPGDVSSGTGWHWDTRGWVVVDGDGAVLDGLHVSATIDVNASNVTIKNTRVEERGESFGISLRHTHGVTIQDSEVSSPEAGAGRLMVGIKDIFGDSTGLKVLRTDVSHTSTGIQVDAGLLQDNYIHDLGFIPGDHTNGTTSNASGSEMLTIRHNTVFNPHDQTDAVSLFQDFGRQNNRVIADNLLAGGAYTLYGGANPGAPATSNIQITGNRFARIFSPVGGTFGPVTAVDRGTGNVWSGNIWDDTGAAVIP